MTAKEKALSREELSEVLYGDKTTLEGIDLRELFTSFSSELQELEEAIDAGEAQDVAVKYIYRWGDMANLMRAIAKDELLPITDGYRDPGVGAPGLKDHLAAAQSRSESGLSANPGDGRASNNQER